MQINIIQTLVRNIIQMVLMNFKLKMKLQLIKICHKIKFLIHSKKEINLMEVK